MKTNTFKWQNVRQNASERTDNLRELSISSRDKRNSCLRSLNAFFHLVFSSSTFRFANFPWVPALQTISKCLNDANQWICKCLNQPLNIYLSVHAAVIIDILVYITDLSLARYYQWHQFLLVSVKWAACTYPAWKPQTILQTYYSHRTCISWLHLPQASKNNMQKRFKIFLFN